MSDEVRRVGNNAMFGEMSWPIPNHENGWRMRYRRPVDSQDAMGAAAEMDAYARLIALPQKQRNEIIRNIRKAMEITNEQ